MRHLPNSALIKNYQTIDLARQDLNGPDVVAPTININALPFTRTVCLGSFVFSGTTTNTPASIAWSASPSGASGSVSGDLENWSTVVSISPDAVGEGIETITFTATNSAGSGTDSETVGFYVSGAHTAFHAQNINGSYNAGLSDTNAISQWNNLGSSGFHATQSTPANQPLYRTNIINGQPIIRFDGVNDSLRCDSSALSDWDFLSNADLVSAESVSTINDVNTFVPVWSTLVSTGAYSGIDFRTTSVNWYSRLSNQNVAQWGGAVSNRTSICQTVRDDSGTPDVIMYIDGTSRGTLTTAGNAIAGEKLTLGDSTNSVLAAMNGDIWRIFLYDLALTTTQLGINKAVDEWALGATFPIN